MAVSFSGTTEKTIPASFPIRGRFEPCLSLETGHADFPLTRVDPLFDEMPVSFGRIARPVVWHSATGWARAALLRLTDLVQNQAILTRPVHLPLPVSILTEDGAAEVLASTCTEAAFCPQEFMIEIQDASLASGASECLDRLDAFRRQGFRIALDARRSAQTPFSSRLRGAIERLRVTSHDLLHDEMLQLRADIISCIGGDVILDRANWRDVDDLRRCGATHASRLLTDA